MAFAASAEKDKPSLFAAEAILLCVEGLTYAETMIFFSAAVFRPAPGRAPPLFPFAFFILSSSIIIYFNSLKLGRLSDSKAARGTVPAEFPYRGLDKNRHSE